MLYFLCNDLNKKLNIMTNLTYSIGYYRGGRFVVVASGFGSISSAEQMIDLKQPRYKHLLLIQ